MMPVEEKVKISGTKMDEDTQIKVPMRGAKKKSENQ